MAAITLPQAELAQISSSVLETLQQALAKGAADPGGAALDRLAELLMARGLSGDQSLLIQTQFRASLRQWLENAASNDALPQLSQAIDQWLTQLPDSPVANPDAFIPLGSSSASAGYMPPLPTSPLAQLPGNGPRAGIAAEMPIPRDLGSITRPEITALSSEGSDTPINAPEITVLTGDASPALGISNNQNPEVTALTSESGQAVSFAGVETGAAGVLDQAASSAIPSDIALGGSDQSGTVPPFTPPVSSLPPSAVSIAAARASGLEGGPGSFLEFTLTRTHPHSAGSVTWQISGADGAILGTQGLSGTVQFAAGESERVLKIEIGDSIVEADATWTVTLTSNEAGIVIANGSAGSLVIDDDDLVSISALQTTVAEGEAGNSQTLSFVISRGEGDVSNSVDWSVSGLDAADFGGTLPSGTVNFAVGETSRRIDLQLTGDRSIEADETLTVSLSNPGVNLALAPQSSVSTVVRNDDGTISLSVDQTSVLEGSAGNVTVLTYTATRTNTESASSVDWSLTGVDATDLASGQ
ncbi:MAG: cadherin domain/calx-beta domain protein, partial [Proteobacteria bacterium]|nr:cadherin domain/calx-beta domain protein [Pseudomonadota bacterium]